MPMQCPGQDSRFMKAADVAEVECPDCGDVMEFWPDDVLRNCPGCGRRTANPKFNMGCLEWCRYAPKCIEHMKQAKKAAAEPIRDELAQALERIFGDDRARIAHARQVLELAEEIGQMEGGDPLVVVPTALLHDIGLAGTEVDSSSPAVQQHGPAGAGEALKVLQSLEFPESVARKVAEIVEHHHERDAMQDANARIIWDADLIVNLQKLPHEEALRRLREQHLTEAGLTVGESFLSR